MKICYKHAEVISEIWSNTVIDWQPVDCTAVAPDQNFISLTHDLKWTSRHELQTRYSFQAMECEETRCFKPFVVDWPVVFPERFIPPRVLYQHNFFRVAAVELSYYFKNPKNVEFASLKRSWSESKRHKERGTQ